MEPFGTLIRREQRAAGRKRNYLHGAKQFAVTEKTVETLTIEAHSVADALVSMALAGEVRLVRIEACEVASGMRSEQLARAFLQRNSFRAWRMDPTTEAGHTLWLSRGGVYEGYEPLTDDIALAEAVRLDRAAPTDLHLARVGLAGLVVKHQINQTQIIQDIDKRVEQYVRY